MSEEILNQPEGVENAEAPVEEGAAPASEQQQDQGEILLNPEGVGAQEESEKELEEPKPTGETYDWETDPLGLSNIVLKDKDGKEFLLAGKYKGETLKEAVQQLEKGYQELTALLRSKGNLPPEEYDTQSEAFQGLAEEAVEGLVGLGKKLGLTQQQLEAFVPEVQALADEVATMTQTHLLAQSWGVEPNSPEFKERLGKVERLVGEAIQNGILTSEQVFGPNGLARTAGGVQALEAILANNKEKGFWKGGEKAPVGLTLEQARAYLVDPESPYHNPTHPDHARIKKLVDDAYRSQPGATEVVLG